MAGACLVGLDVFYECLTSHDFSYVGVEVGSRKSFKA